MKNFGVLYDHILDNVRMAPAYDIVCTRLYIPEDSLALTLDGNRSFFAARQGLLEFGASCDIPKARVRARIIELARITLQTLQDLAHLAERLPGLSEVIPKVAGLYLATFEEVKGGAPEPAATDTNEVSGDTKKVFPRALRSS